MRDLHKYVSAPYHTLLDLLIDNVKEMGEIVTEIGFLKQQELQGKRDVWVNMPGDGVQQRDRAANYSVVDTTTEIMRLNTDLEILRLEHEVIVRLVDAAR